MIGKGPYISYFSLKTIQNNIEGNHQRTFEYIPLQNIQAVDNREKQEVRFLSRLLIQLTQNSNALE